MAAIAAPAPEASRKKLVRRAMQGPLPGAPARSPGGFPGAQCVDRRASSTCSSAIYETGGQSLRAARPPGRRRLAADRIPDEPEGAAFDGSDAGDARRRDAAADRVPRRVVDLPQEFLRLAVPGRDPLRISVAARSNSSVCRDGWTSRCGP